MLGMISTTNSVPNLVSNNVVVVMAVEIRFGPPLEASKDDDAYYHDDETSK